MRSFNMRDHNALLSGSRFATCSAGKSCQATVGTFENVPIICFVLPQLNEDAAMKTLALDYQARNERKKVRMETLQDSSG